VSGLDPFEREQLTRALHDAVPNQDARRNRAASAELLGRRLRRRRRGQAALAAAAVVAVVALVPTAIGHLPGSDDPSNPATSPTAPTSPPSSPAGAAACRTGVAARHADLGAGTPEFLQFCEPSGTWNGVLRYPSEPLTDGLSDLLDSWSAEDLHGCTLDPVSDQYRFQVVYSDGSFAQVMGATGGCQPVLNGDQTTNGSGDELFAQVMAAYGAQYDARFDAVDDPDELTCPSDLLEPGETDRRGPSGSMAANSITMPLTPTRGLLCTSSGAVPLDAEAAERVRVAIQSIPGGDVSDCSGSDDPSYAVVLEDKTGTRRTISVDGSQCNTIRSDFRGGINGRPSDYFLRLVNELAMSS
jgi:hypothetical protein